MVGFIKVPLFLKLLFSTLQKFVRLVLWEAVFILELHSAENQDAIPTIVYKIFSHYLNKIHKKTIPQII